MNQKTHKNPGVSTSKNLYFPSVLQYVSLKTGSKEPYTSKDKGATNISLFLIFLSLSQMVYYANALRKYKEESFVPCTGTLYFSFVLVFGQLLANCSLSTMGISQSRHSDSNIQLNTFGPSTDSTLSFSSFWSVCQLLSMAID